ncbi:MAG TPA: archease [Nitrososphaerales archaeon]|nr:archease [Nitrososphaerales archaeon]
MSGYKFLEHMTDAEIEAYGNDLNEAFENAGKALEDTMVDIRSIASDTTEEITTEGADKESLLYSWLEALILKQDTEGMLYSKFKCRISQRSDGSFELRATVGGERFDPARHEQKTAIKSPTYYAMKIEETAGHFTLRFVLDL